MHQVQGFFAVSTDMSCRSRHSCVNRPVKANVLYAWLKDFLLAFTATKTKLLAKTLRSEAHTYKYVLHISDKQRQLFVHATCHELCCHGEVYRQPVTSHQLWQLFVYATCHELCCHGKGYRWQAINFDLALVHVFWSHIFCAARSLFLSYLLYVCGDKSWSKGTGVHQARWRRASLDYNYLP